MPAHENAGIGSALEALGRRFRGLEFKIGRDRTPPASGAVRVTLVETNVLSEPVRARLVASHAVKGAV